MSFIHTFALAWRNLGRNPRRTITTGLGLAFGIALCVATYGLVDGLNAQLIESLTRLDIGHIQVHHPGFVKRRNAKKFLQRPEDIERVLRKNKAVRAVSPRVFAYGLVGRKSKSAGVALVGVDPRSEPKLTQLHQRITHGRYLETTAAPWPKRRQLSTKEKAQDDAITSRAERQALAELDELEELEPRIPAPNSTARTPERANSDSKSRTTKTANTKATEEAGSPASASKDNAQSKRLAQALSPRPERPLRVILGSALARVLQVKIGDDLHVSSMAIDGDSESVFFEVIGIYHTGTAMHDRNRIYMHIADLRRMSHLGTGAHELSLRLYDSATAPHTSKVLAGAIAKTPGLASTPTLVRDWRRIRPDVDKMLQLNKVSTGIMVFIIFLVASLGVVNTMLMSVFERTRELGVLKALGMSAARMMTLIVGEALLLTLGAATVGTLVGLGLDGYMVVYGLDLRGSTQGLTISGLGLNPVIYGVITARGVLLPTCVLSACCVLASIYPAFRASRLEPAIGMRET